MASDSQGVTEKRAKSELLIGGNKNFGVLSYEPDFIDETVEQLSKILGDDSEKMSLKSIL